MVRGISPVKVGLCKVARTATVAELGLQDSISIQGRILSRIEPSAAEVAELAIVVAIDTIKVKAGVMKVAVAALALGSQDGSVKVDVARRCREKHLCYWVVCWLLAA